MSSVKTVEKKTKKPRHRKQPLRGSDERPKEQDSTSLLPPGKKALRKLRYAQKNMSTIDFLSILAQHTQFTGSVRIDSKDTTPPIGALRVSTCSELPHQPSEDSSFVQNIHIQPLLVLDINGILCHRIRASRPRPRDVPSRPSTTKIAGTPIIPRTDLDQFWHLLSQHFCLAIWTSAKAKTATALLKELVPPQVRDRLLFVWAQQHCIVRKQDASSDEEEVFEKDLERVWEEYPLWNRTNTLLMDDSPEKCEAWATNAVHPPAIHGLCYEDDRSDEFNENSQRVFFGRLAEHWVEYPITQVWERESGDAVWESSSIHQEDFLKVHAQGHMGWQPTIREVDRELE